MKITKQLWLLGYDTGLCSNLVFLYAEDEEVAWKEVRRWSEREAISLPHDARLTCFPKGFRVVRKFLPGEIQEVVE
jgi:hypothetical protein